jgi:hypothetical protein
MSTGATIRPAPATIPAVERLLAGSVAAGCLTLLIVAASLTPDAAGHGTHQQLGLPPCGWLLATGYPCPTCGMTTAFAASAEGNFLTAFVTQPIGALLAVATAVVFWIALHIAAFGSRLGSVVARLWRPRWLWIFAGAWAASWAYKIATWPAP